MKVEDLRIGNLINDSTAQKVANTKKKDVLYYTKRKKMNALERIKVLEAEVALLKANLELKKEPLICNHPAMSFEVYPTDLGKMKWNEAKKACTDLGDGWRLPTRLELLLMYNNQDELGGFASSNYRSSTEYGNGTAWIQNFFNGYQDYLDKDVNGYVRAVRDIRKAIDDNVC